MRMIIRIRPTINNDLEGGERIITEKKKRNKKKKWRNLMIVDE